MTVFIGIYQPKTWPFVTRVRHVAHAFGAEFFTIGTGETFSCLQSAREALGEIPFYALETWRHATPLHQVAWPVGSVALVLGDQNGRIPRDLFSEDDAIRIDTPGTGATKNLPIDAVASIVLHDHIRYQADQELGLTLTEEAFPWDYATRVPFYKKGA